MKQKKFIYPGAIDNIEKILFEFSVSNILLVRGNQSFFRSGAQDALEPILKYHNVIEFTGFSVNPKFEEAQLGYKLLKKNNCNLIIAVGGGSVIDTAKIIKYLAIQKNDSNSSLPLIAIPTTAGTGSEATHFAVVYIDGIKHSFASPFLLPSIAIVDANFLKGQSQYQMAVSGIDAFSQGIESFWSIHSTDISMKYAEKAIKLVWENLEMAIKGDAMSRIKLAEGSYNAGKAINITKTTAPHALSYGFTSKYKIPHGHAVALFLPYFIQYHKTLTNENCNDPRGNVFLKKQIERIAEKLQLNLEDIEREIFSFIKRLKITISFEELSISKQGFLQAIEIFNIERISNNPGRINKTDFLNIYFFNETYYK